VAIKHESFSSDNSLAQTIKSRNVSNLQQIPSLSLALHCDAVFHSIGTVFSDVVSLTASTHKTNDAILRGSTYISTSLVERVQKVQIYRGPLANNTILETVSVYWS